MSKVCNEPHKVVRGKTEPCGRPAMTRYKDRWVCWGCRERLEDLAKATSAVARTIDDEVLERAARIRQAIEDSVHGPSTQNCQKEPRAKKTPPRR